MAILPYKIDVHYFDDVHLKKIIDWCWDQWRYTHGATWTYYDLGRVTLTADEIENGFRWASGMGIRGISKKMLRLTFQFESDFVLFRMRWGDLAE